MMTSLPASGVSLRSGAEAFHVNGKPSGFTVLDYWRWFASDLLGNRQRGIMAEYLVATALEAAEKPRVEWAGFDVLSQDGDLIEVKSAAYRQSWAQQRPSVIQFGIAQSRWAWDPEEDWGTELDPPRRFARVYVFCVLGEESDPAPDPLDLAQWKFYILPTAILDRELRDQKTISLGPLKALARRTTGRGAVRYAELRKAIHEATTSLGESSQ